MIFCEYSQGIVRINKFFIHVHLLITSFFSNPSIFVPSFLSMTPLQPMFLVRPCFKSFLPLSTSSSSFLLLQILSSPLFSPSASSTPFSFAFLVTPSFSRFPYLCHLILPSSLPLSYFNFSHLEYIFRHLGV